MNASAALRHEHDLLREQFTLLEGELLRLIVTPTAARRLTASLVPLLHAHVIREEALLARACSSGAVPADLAEHLPRDHKHYEARLAMLDDLLSVAVPGMEEQAVVQAEYLIRDLRQHLAHDEADLFPRFDRLPEEAAPTGGQAADDETGSVLWESMWGEPL
jgi:hypothetical protein